MKEYEYDIDINTRHAFPAFLTVPAAEALQKEDVGGYPPPCGAQTWDRIEEWASAFDEDRVRFAHD
jgi:hypothetical protein